MGSSAFEPLFFGSGGSMFSMARVCSWVPINYIARCLSPGFYQEFAISSKLVVSGRTLETDAAVDLAPLATQSINQALHPGKP
jgi:hypothetical protein